MNRRDFSRQLGATGVAGASAVLGTMAALSTTLAVAQGGPVEGKDYVRVPSPLPMAPGKIEVVEFFGYWCPHCNAFEPTLDAWARKVPADVNFRRLPVAFQPFQEPYQRLYFALEALGLADVNHKKVFAAIHVGQQRFDKDADVSTWASANGLDGAKIIDAMKSFSTASKVRQSTQLSGAYHIDSVPTLGVHGRFMTSPATAGSPEKALQVVDQLVAQLRGVGAKKG